jgi:hypothetical protein
VTAPTYSVATLPFSATLARLLNGKACRRLSGIALRI